MASLSWKGDRPSWRDFGRVLRWVGKSGRHKHGHRDIVIRDTASHGHCFFFKLLSSECLNVEIKVGKRKLYGGFFFVCLMLKKSEVESRDECILLELAPASGTIIPSLRTSHPFIDFHSVFYRTRNQLFSCY